MTRTPTNRHPVYGNNHLETCLRPTKREPETSLKDPKLPSKDLKITETAMTCGGVARRISTSDKPAWTCSGRRSRSFASRWTPASRGQAMCICVYVYIHIYIYVYCTYIDICIHVYVFRVCISCGLLPTEARHSRTFRVGLAACEIKIPVCSPGFS